MTNIIEIEQQLADEVFKRTGMVVNGNYVDDVYVGISVEHYQPTSGKWWYRPTGPSYYRIVIGDWGTEIKRTHYKMRKNGTFNWEKIIERIVQVRNATIKEQRKRELASTAYDVARQMNKRLTGYEYIGPFKVVDDGVEYSKVVDIEEAIEILTKIRQAGKDRIKISFSESADKMNQLANVL